MKTLNKLFLVALLLALPIFAQGEGGWRGVNAGDMQRVVIEEITTPLDVSTSGNGPIVDIALGGSEAADDQISASSVNPPVGMRTYACKFRDISDGSAAITLRIEGVNQFGQKAIEYHVLDHDGLTSDTGVVSIGVIAFAPTPEPAVYYESVSGVASGDLLDIYPYGFGVKANPQALSDILSEQVYDASGTSYSDAVIASYTFTDRWNKTFSTYFNADLDQHDRVRFWILTDSVNSQLAPAAAGYPSRPVTATVTGE